jgi:hypothetical protein
MNFGQFVSPQKTEKNNHDKTKTTDIYDPLINNCSCIGGLSNLMYWHQISKMPTSYSPCTNFLPKFQATTWYFSNFAPCLPPLMFNLKKTRRFCFSSRVPGVTYLILTLSSEQQPIHGSCSRHSDQNCCDKSPRKPPMWQILQRHQSNIYSTLSRAMRINYYPVTATMPRGWHEVQSCKLISAAPVRSSQASGLVRGTGGLWFRSRACSVLLWYLWQCQEAAAQQPLTEVAVAYWNCGYLVDYDLMICVSRSASNFPELPLHLCCSLLYLHQGNSEDGKFSGTNITVTSFISSHTYMESDKKTNTLHWFGLIKYQSCAQITK